MQKLQGKTHMDEEAEKTIGRLKEKVKATLDLFLRNRNTGTTDAIKASVAHANSPLLLSDQEETGRKIIEDLRYAIENQKISDKLENRATTVSWQSIGSMSYTSKSKGRSVQLIVDNSFMVRAMDSIASAFDFMWSEIQRLRKQNDDLREANDNLAKANQKANSKLKKLKKEQEDLSERVEKLQDKINGLRNGKQ